MMDLERHIKEILEMQSKGIYLDSEAGKKIEGLRKKIKTGHTTGNIIKDFLIASYGLLSDKKLENILRNLKKNFDKHIGEQVLVIKEEETVEGCTGFGHPGYYGHSSTHILSKLENSLVFNSKEERVEIPTKKYVVRHDFCTDKWMLEQGNFKIPALYLLDLDKEVPIRRGGGCFGVGIPTFNGNFSDLKSGLRIVIGSRDVELFFRLGSNHFFYFKKEIEKRKIDYQDLEKKVKKIEKGRGYLNLSYAKGLMLLGENVPDDFREKYEERELDKKKEIVSRLEGLIEREVGLTKEINAIYNNIDRRPRVGDRILGSIGPDVPGMSEDDANVVSAKQRIELKETRQEIASYLNNALKLEMHKIDLIIEKKPGITINVPEYITKMCENYKVKIQE